MNVQRLEDETRDARSEIECYKDEMAKNEDYMKKALMRGVCALNMEAMSIFNETIGNSNKTSSTNSMDINMMNDNNSGKVNNNIQLNTESQRNKFHRHQSNEINDSIKLGMLKKRVFIFYIN